jgi:hypothetical protein
MAAIEDLYIAIVGLVGSGYGYSYYGTEMIGDFPRIPLRERLAITCCCQSRVSAGTENPTSWH